MTERDPDASLRAGRAHAYENPRPEIQRHVPESAARVLDLGCSSGSLGAALKRSAREVVGVELDPGYAESAAARLDSVVVADVEALAAAEDLEERLGAFDCLIAADVLEHTRDPWTVLRRFAGLLQPGGTAIVSLPNVRYWETFWQLGRHGDWPRRSQGIFDRDHLRWFTVGTGIELVEQAGLTVAEVDRQLRMRPDLSRWDRFASALGRTPLRPFLTFQFVVVGRL